MSESGPEETRHQRWEQQTADNFVALGRYVQAFEHLVGRARSGCSTLLGGTEFAQIVLGHQALTAKPMFDILRAMMITAIRSNIARFTPSDVKTANSCLRYLSQSVQDVISDRNTLVHGTWYIGWNGRSERDFREISMYKTKVTGDGVRLDMPVKSVQELDQLREKCETTRTLLGKLIDCIEWQLISDPKPGLILANIFFENGSLSVTQPPYSFRPLLHSM
jgi:hypothetical protein